LEKITKADRAAIGASLSLRIAAFLGFTAATGTTLPTSIFCTCTAPAFDEEGVLVGAMGGEGNGAA